MKTKTSVLRDYSEYKTIINAVVNRVGLDHVEDINGHGIDGGYNGFIYHNDTHGFAMRHRKTIIDLLENEAADFGMEVVEMVAGFGVFRQCAMDNEDRKELYRYLGGGRCEQSTITNLMAWYAAETVCRWFED